MAVDTAAKRFSSLNYGMPWRGPSVLPDGTVGQGDRQAVAFLYSGILATGGVVYAGMIRVAAGMAYLGGAVQGQAYTGGAIEGQNYLGGAVAGTAEITQNG